MKIDAIHIDGYGQFHQLPIKDLSTGLTIFKGANEAGKSTILSFIRIILFGFPNGRGSYNLYPPVEGGNHGGRLVITTDAGERCVVERYIKGGNDAKITLPDGSIGGEAYLNKILGYADQTIFENIYAFGLEELQRFETLNSDAIKNKLYSAGTGIGTISISEVQNSIKKRETDLFKKQGSKPPINNLFKRIKEINKKISELEEEQKEYDSFNFEVERLSTLINDLNGDNSEIQKELNHILDLISIWDDWRKIQDSRNSLVDLPKIENFPEKGVDNLERIQEKIEDISNLISSLEKDLEKNNVEQRSIIVDQDLLHQRNEILNLGNGIEKYRSERRLIPEIESKLQRENSDLLELFKELGKEWNEDKLNHFDHSIPVKETVIQKRKEIDEIDNKVKVTQNELKQVKNDIERINGEISDIDKKIRANTIKMGKDEANIVLEAIRYLRIKYPLLKEKESELKNIQKEEALFATIQPKTINQPVWPAGMILIAGMIGLIYGYLTNDLIPGFIIFLILSITAFIYILSTRQKKNKSVKDLSEDLNYEKTPDISTLKDQAIKEKDALKTEMIAYSKSCGFIDIPDPIMLEQKASELDTIGKNLRNIEDLNQRREELSDDIGETNARFSELDMRLKFEESERERIFNEWKDWLSKYDLDSSLSPEIILEIFLTIKACYDKQKTIRYLESQLDSNKESMEIYEEKMKSVLKQSNRSYSGTFYDTEIEKLQQDIENVLRNSERIDQLNVDSEKIIVELRSTKGRHQTLVKERSDLLDSGYAKTLDEFLKNAKIWAESIRLKSEIQSAENQIKRISSHGKQYDEFIIELENTDLSNLKEKEKELKDRLKSKNDEISDNIDKRGALRNKIEQLECRNEGSMLRMEAGALAEDLHKKSRNWAVQMLANEILRKAIEVYEKERQPTVIIEAQSFFSKITNNRYKRIYSPLSSSDIFVEDHYNKQKSILQLSRGTTEQLYLALRFGFINEFGKHSESLPIVFDDILVNFDPERSRNAIEAIIELAETNQVLYFTCHPETEKMLNDLKPDALVIDLDNCKGN
ncbi:MAG TPA: AAA family ATPase [Candidatus Limnocylindrales bacterium]|nr:AAA family ATPase [Candidatus Limnocylindrales bacterium]